MNGPARVVAAALFLLHALPAHGDVLLVPAEHATIREALAVAVFPDTVVVSCGVYHETGLLLPAGVSLFGDPDSSCTVLDGGAAGVPILEIRAYDSDSQVRGITFRNATAPSGAAIHQPYAESPGPLVSGCRFEGNAATIDGGAIHGARIRLSDCEFIGNVADDDGGAVNIKYPDVTSCVFRGNRAGDDGGGLYGENGTVTSCRFEGNTTGDDGGGLYGVGVDLLHCVFRADSSADRGGGAYTGGHVQRTVFERNHAAHGGGLSGNRATLSRFVENTATVGGGGMHVNAWGTVESCTFLRNAAPSGGGVWANNGSATFRRTVIQGSTMGSAASLYSSSSFEACNLWGNAGGDWSGWLAYRDLNGNFAADGLFCDEPAESLAISSASPLLPGNNAWGVHVGAESLLCEPAGTVITSVPPGMQLVVDGATVFTPREFDWPPASLHLVEAPALVEPRTGVRVEFEGWSDGDSLMHSVIAGDLDGLLVARYDTKFLVTMEAEPHGTVTPATGWHTPPTTVTIHAVADSAYRVTGWTGTGLGSYTGADAQREILLRGPITQRARFTFDGTYRLTMVVDGGGSVTPPTGDYHVGNIVQIRATAPPLHIFDAWEGSGTGSYSGPNAVASVRMDGPITQTARFHYAGTAPVTMQVSGNGTVTPPSGEYPRETLLGIDAWPAEGWSFYRWVGEGAGSYTGTERSAAVTPFGPVTETAYFAEGNVYPFTISGTANGLVSPQPGTYQHTPGTQLGLSAIPMSGFRLREWIGTGMGSYSGPDPYPTITIHEPVTQHAVFEPDGNPHGYEFALSASPTDPLVNHVPPANGPRTLYLWLVCSEFGISAFEAGVQSTILFGDFVPAPGVVDFGYGTDLLLGILDCPTGETARRVLGSWPVVDTGGKVWLTHSRVNELFGTVDCGSLPTIWHDPFVRGFSSAGPVPTTGSNVCQQSIPVMLSQLAAVPGNRCVVVTWVTSADSDHEGFHVHRSDRPEGPYERVTTEMLVGRSPHRFEDRSVEADRIYYYKVGGVEVSGREELFGPVVVTTPNWPPLVTAMGTVAPSPFRDETELRFSLAKAGRARLVVYDLAGRVVQELVDADLPAGDHAAIWSGRTPTGRAASGIYFVRFEAGERRETRRVVFLGGR